MKILVLNGSPAGENSVTLYTVKFIEKHFPEHTFEVLHVGRKIRAFEKDFAPCEEALKNAELILFCYPVYTFLVPAQLHRFIELIKERGIDVGGKLATQVSTSKHFYDVTAHNFIQENCADLGLNYIKGLSADMDDLLTDKGRKEALDFFRFVVWSAEHRAFEPSRLPKALPKAPEEDTEDLPAAEKTQGGKTVIVADFDPEGNEPLGALIESFRAALPMKSEVVNIREFPFAGGCLGCFNCASTGKCVYKDRFDDYLRNNIQSADALVYAYTVKDHSMGYRFKLYDDRQFCNGHRTVTMGKPVAYLVSGNLDAEPNLRLLMESRSEVGGNFLAGIATTKAEAERAAAVLAYAAKEELTLPKNFYGVGGLKIFRDLIYQMQGLMREDHRFYKKHGFYDFPQKRKGRIVAMYAVGAMMSNKKLSKKVGSKMTEGMVMPYQNALKKH